MKSIAEKILTPLCPKHKRSSKGRKGFRCICFELGMAYGYGLVHGNEAAKESKPEGEGE